MNADDWDDGDGEIEGLGEPEPQLSPDDALDALQQLPPDQLAAGLQYLEKNHPGLGQPLLEAYVDRQERDRLTAAWTQLDHLNQAADAFDARREAEQDQQLAAAEETAHSLIADAARRHGGNVNIDPATTLAAANQVMEMQLENWRAQGYSDDEIEAAYGPQLAAAAIEKAAEMVKHAHISVRALGKV